MNHLLQWQNAWMKRFEFRLNISPEQYLPYYRGEVRLVVVSLPNGQSISFPASLLRKFLHAEGIHGDFILSCDDQNRGAELQRKPAE